MAETPQPVFSARGLTKGAGWAAFAIEDARARKRAVKVVRRNNVEHVVVYPSDALRDGSRVEIISPR